MTLTAICGRTLKAILDCGISDLCILDGIDYDLEEIIDEMISDGKTPTLNAIVGEVFRKGVEELALLISDRLCAPGKDDSAEVLETLRTLNPERDISWRCNWRDARGDLPGGEQHGGLILRGG